MGLRPELAQITSTTAAVCYDDVLPHLLGDSLALLQTLRRWLGFPDAATSSVDVSELRRRVEELLESDDAPALTKLLASHREAGKILIRQYEEEVRAAAEPDRPAIARRITALVAIFAQGLRDTEPLSWFRTSEAPEERPAAVALEQAQQAFASGNFPQAEEVATEGLRLLSESGEPTPPRAALESSLLAVRGGVSVRFGRLDEALRHFDLSMVLATASGDRELIAAARLNLVDLHTRRDSFDANDEALGAAMESTIGTRYEDVIGKLFVERGVALTRRGDLAPAISVFDEVITFRPEWPFPTYQRAWARFLRGDSGGALEDYREVARRHPVFFTVQREIRCLESVGAGQLPIETYRSFCLVRGRTAQEPQAVAESAERMVERHPDFAAAWVLLAEARLALGRFDEAREALAESLRHDPDPDTAAAALFAEWNLARAAGEPHAVGEVAERLLSAYPDQPAAEIVRRLGNHPKENRAVRWTWALDGTLRVEDVSSEGRTPPPPGSPG